MGAFKDLFKNFNPMNLLGDLGSSALGFLGAWFGQQSQYKYNKRLQDDAQAFNADEAAKNRDWQTLINRENNQFNAAQAELSRQFQEDFYLKYQSPSAMMSQYRDAGLNPVLAVGHATNTPPSVSSASAGSSPSGAAASSGMNGVAPMDLIGFIASIMKLKAEINNINADSDLKGAQAYAAERAGLASNSQSALNFSQVKLNNQKVSESMSVVSNLIEQTNSERLRQGLIIAEKVLRKNESANLAYDILKKQYDETFKEKYGFYPDSSIVKSSLGILNETVRNIEYGIDKTVNFVKNKYNEWF